jgi:MFS family permease
MRDGLRAATGGLPRPFWFMWAGVLITRCGSFVLPFLALYLSQGLGLPLPRAGLVLALYGAGGAVAGPLGGYLADHVGRRATMVTALALGGTGMIALGFAHRLEVLAPAVFLLALVTEMYRPAMQAAVADLAGPRDRVRAFGLLYWVINVGFAIGLTLGGLVAAKSFFWLFVGDGVTTMLFAVLIAIGVPETRPPQTTTTGAARPHALAGFLEPYRDGRFVFFLLLSFLIALVFMQNATTFAVDMTGHGVSRAVYGRVLALNGVIIVLVQPLLGPLLARLHRPHVLAVGAALIGLGFGLNALAHGVAVYTLSVVVWTLGEMGVLPIANVVVADLAPARARGRYQGAYGLAFGSAVCVAPVLGMLTLERLGSTALWTGCLGIGLLVSAGHLTLSRVLARAREPSVTAAEPAS